MNVYSIFAVFGYFILKTKLIHCQLTIFVCVFIKEFKMESTTYLILQHELFLSELNFRLKMYIICKHTHAKDFPWLRGKESTGR